MCLLSWPCQLHQHVASSTEGLFMRWKKCLGFSLAAILGGALTAQGQSQAPATLPSSPAFYERRPHDVPYRLVQAAPPETPPATGTPSGGGSPYAETRSEAVAAEEGQAPAAEEPALGPTPALKVG